ncbi:MAG TPA: type II toxin-antitoxin system HicA family toxin [Candidatus Hydrogenedentes bacterium]|nr:type II toxin-antitoxin system HicA family toxin [Candidatus Hydrogenedentota bacterium]HRZ81096.1 type II toxin-antitoxin system HicA family toxin [Candidatus Hydrogenedentota bacterium]
MPPRPMTAREIVQRLERLGFRRVSQRGSHLKLRRERGGTTYTVIVPMHGKDIAVSVVGRILQQAGLEWSEFDA